MPNKHSHRVWWEPTDDPDKEGFAGAWWPVKVLGQKGRKVTVKYDNGETEDVSQEHVQSNDLPVDFGEEAIPLQVGEFCEIHNGSKSDPCAWVAKIKKVLPSGDYIVEYPFHDDEPEKRKESIVRRARVMEDNVWRLIKPHQTWRDGDVTSPVELELIDEEELGDYVDLPEEMSPEADSHDKKATRSAPAKSNKNGPSTTKAARKRKRGKDESSEEEPEDVEESEEEEEPEEEEEEEPRPKRGSSRRKQRKTGDKPKPSVPAPSRRGAGSEKAAPPKQAGGPSGANGLAITSDQEAVFVYPGCKLIKQPVAEGTLPIYIILPPAAELPPLGPGSTGHLIVLQEPIGIPINKEPLRLAAGPATAAASAARPAASKQGAQAAAAPASASNKSAPQADDVGPQSPEDAEDAVKPGQGRAGRRVCDK